MQLIRGTHNLRPGHRGCVLTIGNFDGVHRGHQALLAQAQALARAHNQPLAVMTFEPTPREFFGGDAAPGRISPLRDRLRLLEEQGVARVLLQGFHQRFAAWSAEDFVDELLVRRLGARALLVGDDFRFGARRAGDLALLRARGEQHGFAVHSLDTVCVDALRCSSTAVREALGQADLARAAGLLGRPYSMSGRVRRGLQLGRKLGMPTANVTLRRRPALRLGVYAVWARLGSRRWAGVASLGIRPTLGLTECLLETHFFESPGDIYGQLLDVEFAHYLRDEQRFDSLDALSVQMQADKSQAIALLSAHAP